jgi:hypothetical protein
MHYAVSSTSLAHTFGNITSYITEYIKGLFPLNFFKTVHISSTIAYKQIDMFRLLNKEFIKKIKPILIIKPRIDFNADDVFLDNTFLTRRMWDSMLGDVDFNNLQHFMIDDKNKYRVNYLLNRIKVYFDVMIVTETPLEQFNVAHYFRNITIHDSPFLMATSLESHVPKPIFDGISKIINKPIYNSDGNPRDFIEYLNNHSAYPITYKLKNASGNDEFFRYYQTNVESSITNFSVDEGSKRGFISDINTINFTVSAEFYTSGLYYLFTHDKQIIDMISFDISVDNKLTGIKEIIPMFTMANMYKQTLENGWKMYQSSMFKTEKSGHPDTLDLKLIITPAFIRVIEYHTHKGLPLDTFMKFKLFKDARELSLEREEFSLDYSNLTVTTNVSNVNSTYRIFLYVNTLYINEMADEIFEISKER